MRTDRVSREYRDALGRVVRTAAKGFAEKAWIVTDADYDSLGRVARQSAPYHAGASRYCAETGSGRTMHIWGGVLCGLQTGMGDREITTSGRITLDPDYRR